MKLTYIGHSGVSLEWENCSWVIDYYNGKMPDLGGKKLFVFSSHAHGDHFNPEVFKIFGDRSEVRYVLSSDIEKKIKRNTKRYGISGRQLEAISYVEPRRRYEFDDGAGKKLYLETLLSTDEGVAFVIRYDGKTVYHAGDLNWWAWDDNEPGYDKWMRDTYLGEIEKLKGRTVDLAFVPVDRRLEKNMFLGADAFMRTTDTKRMFPIHMFGAFGVGEELCGNDISEPYRDRVSDIEYNGQTFDIQL